MHDHEQCVCGHLYRDHDGRLFKPCRRCDCEDFTDSGDYGEFDEEYAR